MLWDAGPPTPALASITQPNGRHYHSCVTAVWLLSDLVDTCVLHCSQMSGDLSPTSCSASLWQQGEPVRQHKTLKPNALRDTGKGLFCVDWAWEYMCISVHLQLAFLDSWRGFRHSECEGDSYIVKYLLCCLIIRLSLWCIYSPFTIFFAVVRCIKSKPSKPSWKSNYTPQIFVSPLPDTKLRMCRAFWAPGRCHYCSSFAR